MTHAFQPLSRHRIEALAASAIVWLTRLLGVVLDPSAQRRRVRLLRFVRHIERCVECILFLYAVDAYGPPPQQRRHPRAAPQGFRRTRGNLRLFWKSARIRADRRAGFPARIAQLLCALAHPAPYVARFLKQLCKGLRTHLVACSPPAAALNADTAHAVAFADTS